MVLVRPPLRRFTPIEMPAIRRPQVIHKSGHWFIFSQSGAPTVRTSRLKRDMAVQARPVTQFLYKGDGIILHGVHLDQINVSRKVDSVVFHGESRIQVSCYGSHWSQRGEQAAQFSEGLRHG